MPALLTATLYFQKPRLFHAGQIKHARIRFLWRNAPQAAYAFRIGTATQLFNLLSPARQQINILFTLRIRNRENMAFAYSCPTNTDTPPHSPLAALSSCHYTMTDHRFQPSRLLSLLFALAFGTGLPATAQSPRLPVRPQPCPCLACHCS